MEQSQLLELNQKINAIHQKCLLGDKVNGLQEALQIYHSEYIDLSDQQDTYKEALMQIYYLIEQIQDFEIKSTLLQTLIKVCANQIDYLSIQEIQRIELYFEQFYQINLNSLQALHYLSTLIFFISWFSDTLLSQLDQTQLPKMFIWILQDNQNIIELNQKLFKELSDNIISFSKSYVYQNSAFSNSFIQSFILLLKENQISDIFLQIQIIDVYLINLLENQQTNSELNLNQVYQMIAQQILLNNQQLFEITNNYKNNKQDQENDSFQFIENIQMLQEKCCFFFGVIKKFLDDQIVEQVSNSFEDNKKLINLFSQNLEYLISFYLYSKDNQIDFYDFFSEKFIIKSYQCIINILCQFDCSFIQQDQFLFKQIKDRFIIIGYQQLNQKEVHKEIIKSIDLQILMEQYLNQNQCIFTLEEILNCTHYFLTQDKDCLKQQINLLLQLIAIKCYEINLDQNILLKIIEILSAILNSEETFLSCVIYNAFSLILNLFDSNQYDSVFLKSPIINLIQKRMGFIQKTLEQFPEEREQIKNFVNQKQSLFN